MQERGATGRKRGSRETGAKRPSGRGNRLTDRSKRLHMHASWKYLGRQAAGQQRPNDDVLRLRRNIQGMNPRDRLCHRRGQRAAVALSQAFFSLVDRGCSTKSCSLGRMPL
jgi:hypothetical protein